MKTKTLRKLEFAISSMIYFMDHHHHLQNRRITCKVVSYKSRNDYYICKGYYIVKSLKSEESAGFKVKTSFDTMIVSSSTLKQLTI